MTRQRFVIFAAILMVLPFLGAIYLVMQATNDDIAGIKKERIGAQYHQELFRTQLALQAYRGRHYLAEVSGQRKSDLPTLKSEVIKHINAVDALSTHAEMLELTAQWEQTKKLLQQALEKNKDETPRAYFDRQTAAIVRLLALMRKTGSNSTLFLDPEVEASSMIDLMVNIIPDIVWHLGLVRGKLAANLAGGTFNADDERQLIEIKGKLEDLANRYQYSISVIEKSDPENVSNAVERKVGAAEKLKGSTEMFLHAMKNAEHPTTPHEFFVTMGTTIEAFEDAYYQFANHLEWHLSERISSQRTQHMQILAKLLGVLVASAIIVLLVNKNITAREEVEQAARTNAILGTVVDGIITINVRGLIESFNPSAERIFGYAASEVIGKNVKMLMPEPYHSEHDGYLKHHIETGERRIIGTGREVKARRKDGSIFAMELAVGGFEVQGQRMFVGSIRDITQRKRAEAEIQNYVQMLTRSNQELDDFAYIASHDLKEPIRGVTNNVLFMLEDYGDAIEESGKKRLNRMVYLCKRMEQLVDDLLYFSRLGRQDLAVQEVDLNGVIKDIALMMETTLHENHAEIIIPTPLPAITCDVPRTTELFRNLISNAVKYNKSEHKIIEIGLAPESTQKRRVFYVKDNGIGIEEQFYQDVFRIFKRLNEEDETAKGTGVGLTFVKKIVERHGGKIWIESTPGKGTTFYFTLNPDDATPTHSA